MKSSRGPWQLWEVPTYRPSEPVCNTTYHVRRPGCSIGVARCRSLTHSWSLTLPEVALSLSESSSGFTTWVGSGQLSCLCWKQIDNCHRPSVASHAHPMRARRTHSRGNTDICCGTSLAYCYLMCVHSLCPLKIQHWYLLWDHSPLCYKYSSPLVAPLKTQHC